MNEHKHTATGPRSAGRAADPQDRPRPNAAIARQGEPAAGGEHDITLSVSHPGAITTPPQDWVYVARVARACGIPARNVRVRLTLLDVRPRPLLIAQATVNPLKVWRVWLCG